MSAAPNPSTLLLWGAVGIGAYFLFTRSAAMQAVAAQAGLDTSKNYRDAAYANAAYGALGTLTKAWNTGGGQWNNPSAYVPPSVSYPDYGAPSGATGAWL